MKKIIATSVGLVLLTSSASFASVKPYNAKDSVVAEKMAKVDELLALAMSRKSVVKKLSRADTPTPSPVPLPAAGWMLLAGVGGLVAMRRRGRA